MDNTVLYDLSYWLYAIGAKDGNRDCGCIVNTVFQITTEGPIIALSMNKENYTYELIKKTNKFSVSILSEATNPEVISRLGFVCGKENDKWNGFSFDHLNDLPIVKENALGHMICEVQNTVETPTHQAEEVVSDDTPKWICSVCGYVYDGADFDAEPDSYTCPICHVPKTMFDKK